MSRVEEARFEPMSLGTLLDRAFHLYVENFALMVGIAALVYVPLLLFDVVGTLVVPSEEASVAAIAALVLAAIGALLTALIFIPLATGATTKAISERYLGRPATVGSALRAALHKVLPLLVTQFVVGIIVFVGLLLFIVPGILWALSYALVAPVTILETSNPAQIRRRSWELVSGSRMRVLGVAVVVFLLQLLPGLVIISLNGLAGAAGLEVAEGLIPAVELVLNYASGILLAPLGTIAITLLYYDFRIRKEGFDLEMLSQAISAPRSGE